MSSRLALLLILLPTAAAAQEKFLLQDGQRIVFLGDSNTFAGTWIAYIDAYLVTRFPEKKFELINLGLPSETISGLSELAHPYPRPDVHERLDRALAKAKPNFVIACYGMNDGIYSPFSEERFHRYRDGTQKLIEKVARAGAKIMLVTPAPFDPVPIKKHVRPGGEANYSWLKPYENYDETLTRYSAWLVSLRDKGFVVADPHSAIQHFLREVRKQEPGIFLSGDGIHPNPTGHALIASQVLQALNAPDEVDLAEIDLKMKRALNGKVRDIAVTDHEVKLTWTSKLPWPADPRWHPRLPALAQLKEHLNRHELIVTRLPAAQYALFEGDKDLGNVTRAEVKIGLDMTRFADLSSNQQAAALWKLVEERQKLLGSAWLTDVGHKRPGTPKGIALSTAQQQAALLDTQIRKLAQPLALHLRLVEK